MMHSNKFRFESDLKCRAIFSSRDGEIKQFRFESDMQCALPFLKESLILGESNQTNSDLNQTWSVGLYAPQGMAPCHSCRNDWFWIRFEVCVYMPLKGRSLYISGLSQVWLCFKTYSNLNHISNLIEIWISENFILVYNVSYKWG